MPLNRWIKQASHLLAENSTALQHRSRRPRRRPLNLLTARQYRSGEISVRSQAESLEDRVLPASLVWVGDINPQFASAAPGNTNWDTNTLPASGDNLTFPDITGVRSLTNDSSNGSAYTLDFTAGGYTVAGNTIALTATGTDIRSTTGSTTVQTPLTLAADTTIDISAGTTTLAGSLSGSGGFTKTGSGELLITATGNFTGNTQINAGNLNLQGTLNGGGNLEITSTATFTGNGTFSGPVSVSGTVAPGITTGTLHTGPVTFTNSGSLNLQIHGNTTGEFDALSCNGTATLNGTFRVLLPDGFTPAEGSIFEVLTATSVTGWFRSYEGLSYNGGRLVPIQTPSALLLVATTIPTGGITFYTTTHDEGLALASFFANRISSVTLAGSLNVLDQQITAVLQLSRRAATPTAPALTIISATEVSLQLSGSSGNLISVSASEGIIILSANGVAADISVNVSESLEPLTFGGIFGLAINSTGNAVSETVQVGGSTISINLPAGPYVRLTASNATLQTDIIDVRGNLTLETTGSEASREILIGASGLSGFIGDNAGTPGLTSDDTGVRFSDGSLFGFINSAGYVALSTAASAELQGVDPITLSATASLELNTTGSPVLKTLQIGGVNHTLDLAAGLRRIALRNVTAAFSGFAEVTGNFAIERVVDGDTTTLRAAAVDAGAFLGINRGQPDEMGVRLSHAGIALLIEKTQGSAPKFAATSAGGTVSISGLPDLGLSGSLAFETNQLGRSINTTIAPLSGPAIPLVFETQDSVQRFGGSLTLDVPGFTRLTGKFGFEKGTAATPQKLKFAATEVSAFLGHNAGTADTSDDIGVQISGARLGGVFFKGTTQNTYAFDALGTAATKNIPGLTVEGLLAARINTTGAAVNETVNVPGGDPVPVVFAENENDAVFSGRVTADAAGFASIDAAFSVTKSTEQLTIAATDVTAFVGAGGSGIKVTDAKLGAVINTAAGKFALVAEGAVKEQNLTGLTLGGNAALRINTLGAAITQTISTPGGSVTIDFPNADQVIRVQGSVKIGVGGFVDAGGDLVVEKRVSGDNTALLIQASDVSAFLGTGGDTADTADDMGVRLTTGAMDLRIFKNTISGVSSYALAARGSAQLVGI
ncbi:MAG: beta strand repeat-containing protein, partial [Planctomyces sp.]